MAAKVLLKMKASKLQGILEAFFLFKNGKLI